MIVKRTSTLRRFAVWLGAPRPARPDARKTPLRVDGYRNLRRSPLLPVLLFLLMASSAPLAKAEDSTESLSRCLADNTSGKDRKDLVRWSFFAMAAHPEIKQFASPELAQAREEVNSAMANVLTRLLTDTCLAQARAAFKQGGFKAVEDSFQTVSKLAMQELMVDKNVVASASEYTKFVDVAKFAKAIGGN